MTYHIDILHIKLLADLHTPVSIYNKLRDVYPGSFLFESADYHDRSDNKSFICFDPIASFEAKQNVVTVQFPEMASETQQVESPIDVLHHFRQFIQSFKAIPTDLPMDTQGLWGYSSFESVAYMEDIIPSAERPALKDNPDLSYRFFRHVIIFDHFKKELWITEHRYKKTAARDETLQRIRQIIESNQYAHFGFQTKGTEQPTIGDSDYEQMVARGIQHCIAGDTFQVVLSREFHQAYTGDDFTLYRCLRSVNPSPYLFYLDYGNFKIFGSSPESQLQVHAGIASINPIAGTVKRGDNPKEDQRNAEILQNNAKEISEHVMLVDLARNDLSKNATNIQVDTYGEIQYFAQVIHMVSRISGHINDDKSGIDIYADTFPAGTLSGAPKYRAMEIIFENEIHTRNFYGGAVGFFGFNGSVNHAIIIRSILSKNNTLIYQAGAGVVAKSTPKGELQEVNNKIRAIRMAIQNANAL